MSEVNVSKWHEFIVSSQTSSKKVGETFTISEENWIIKNYFLQKAYEKTKTN